MEDMYGLHHHIHHPAVGDFQSLIAWIPGFGGSEQMGVPSCAEAAAHYIVSEVESFAGGGGGTASASPVSIGGGAGVEAVSSSSAIKAKIAAHPRYPRLLEAYIDCQKVGAPPEVSSLLDEIQRENDVSKRNAAASGLLGTDPELDEFMDRYCDVLLKYKSDLARPFDEATRFLNNMEVHLSNVYKGSCHFSDKAAGSSDNEFSGGINVLEAQIINEDRDLKDELLRKYGGYLSGLKQEFSKKKKKGKLPREAQQMLLNWWNVHLKWPYPTEADKIALAKSTCLNQKQINNWFINQRKRHWKPSQYM